MKTRICLFLPALMTLLLLVGCQQSATIVEEKSTVATEEKPQPKPAKTSRKNEYKVSWQEECVVKDAFLSSGQILEELGLISAYSSGRTKSVSVRNPRTGRQTRKQVSVGAYDKHGNRDGLSAFLKTHSIIGIEFQIDILLVPENTCRITINAISTTQHEDILKQQCDYLKQKISDAIQNPPTGEEETAESLPCPETMILDRTVSHVFGVIYNWSGSEKFDWNSDGHDDKYYRRATSRSDSGIQFEFRMRLIDENKTKLEIKISNYEDKEEFTSILKGLMDALEELETDQPASRTAAYTETKTLHYPINAVNGILSSWVKDGNFSFGRNSGGDAFYKHFSCRTAAGIDFSFQMYMIGTNETKLEITINDQQGREEFPMIFKSLEDTLNNIGEKQVEPAAKEAPE